MSTRKVDQLTRALGNDTGISRSTVSRICGEIDEAVREFLTRRIDHTWFPYLFLDATYLDVRHRGRVVSQAVVVATGVSDDGRREILGMALGDAETTDFWTEFLRGLRDRGLKVATEADPEGVVLVTSDAHAGLMITLNAMLVHATEDLRGETAKKTQMMVARHCAALRPRGLETPEDANRHALRSIARRWIALNDEIKEHEAQIEQLVLQRAPHLLDEFGIGVDTAAEILIVAGDNPERIRSEAAFAKLAGISPVPTGSGMTSGKHRINHGGHRQLNAAIYRTVIVRTRFHEPTIAYIARRNAEGKSKRDIIRCLKRYVIREVYHLIKTDPRQVKS